MNLEDDVSMEEVDDYVSVEEVKDYFMWVILICRHRIIEA